MTQENRTTSPFVRISSDEWETPPEIFEALDLRYGPFDLDAAALPATAKCARYYSPEQDGLSQPWAGRTWLNPPYSRGLVALWLAKARREVVEGRATSVCCLVPASSSEGWWREQVTAGTGRLLRTSSRVAGIGEMVRRRYAGLIIEVLYLSGRVHFLAAGRRQGSARFSSAVVTYSRPGSGIGRPKTTAPGLARMREATPLGLCPTCLDPLAAWYGAGRHPSTCGDSACRTAYQRLYRRDYRAAQNRHQEQEALRTTAR